MNTVLVSSSTRVVAMCRSLVICKFSSLNFHGLTSGCWNAGNLIRAALLHLNVAKVEDASHGTE